MQQLGPRTRIWPRNIIVWQLVEVQNTLLWVVAHSSLVIIYHLLEDRVRYQELGDNFFDERDAKR
jgi:hypothetical protein